MLLKKIFKHFWLQKNGNKKNLPLLNPTPDELLRLLKSTDKTASEYSLLKSNDNLNTTKKLNTALKNIDQTLKKEGSDSLLILQKSDILIRKEKYKQALQLLHGIYKDKSDSESSKTAKELILLSHHLRQKNAQKKNIKTLEKLHSILRKYNYKPRKIPPSNNLSPGFDIIKSIQQESRQARTSDLPNLSRELIEQTLQAGYQSPWLLHDKALSLIKMGQRAKALSILRELQAESQGEELITSISKTIRFIKNNPKQDPRKIDAYLSKESMQIIKSSDLKTTFLSELEKAGPEANVKILILKQARSTCKKNSQETINLCNLVLDYIPGDNKSLQLKGEALARLGRDSEAVKIWKDLNKANNKKAANKVFDLISQNICSKAHLISSKKSPKAAITYYIKENLRHKITPTLNKQISKILMDLNKEVDDFISPELQKHQLQLLFNTIVIDYIEGQMRKQGRLDDSSKAQKPDTIGKTASKAG